MEKVNQVVVIGGMHGNELIGVYLIRLFEQFPHLIQRQSFETLTLLGNPQAINLCKRYVDKDLNRCFRSEDIQNPTLSSYEDKQARQIYQTLELDKRSRSISSGESQIRMFVDLHSTTANMGITLILVKLHPLLLKLAAYLSSINNKVKVIYMPSYGDNGFLISQCELGLALEVGAIPQGVLNADLFQQTQEIFYRILDYMEAFNQGSLKLNKSELTFYEYVEAIYYPKNEHGEIKAMVHPQLQFKDYEPLNPGDPILLNFEGTTIVYKGNSTIYPIFINEAAYYEKGIAMCVTKKQEIII
jgi:aspartoacylase